MFVNKFLTFLENRGRMRVIYDRDGQQPYMYRYYLCFKDKLSESEDAYPIPFNLMIHKICQSDPDDLHDHTWWYAWDLPKLRVDSTRG